MPAQQPQARDGQESLGRLGQRPVAVDEFVDDRDHAGLAGCRSQPPVGLQPQPVAADVVRRQVRVDGQIDTNVLDLLGDRDRLAVRGCLERGPVGLDGLADQSHVEVEADPGDVTGLFGSQYVARAANLQVLHGHCHPGAEFIVLRDRGQAVVRGLGERCLPGIEEVRIAALTTPPDPAA